MTMQTVRNQKGVTVIAAVATLLIFSLMGMVVVSLVGTETYSAIHQEQTLEAYWIAEGGIHRAATYMSREDGNCTAISGAAAFTNAPLGRGTFTVTATRYDTSAITQPTTLSANITNTDTTITVGSTTGYAPRGRIAIDSELINYTGTTATSFTGAKRGMDVTTAAAHTPGAAGARP